MIPTLVGAAVTGLVAAAFSAAVNLAIGWPPAIDPVSVFCLVAAGYVVGDAWAEARR